MPMALSVTNFVRFPNSGLSDVSCSGGTYSMETTETGSGGRHTTIIKKTELTIREELQKDVDMWLVGAI